MKQVALWTVVGALSLSSPCLAADGEQRQQNQPQARFGAGTEAVMVDVSVRGPDGGPVVGLPSSAFKVFEDGKPQRVVAFDGPVGDPASREPAPSSPASVRTTPTFPPSEAPIVALVFEQLSVASLQLATRAAAEIVKQQETRAFVALFTADRALHVVTPYTTSREVLHEGLDAVSRTAGLPRRRAGTVPSAEFATAEAGAPTPETKADSPYIRGLATIDALSAVVEGLRPLPGRKMVILFSEGLALDAGEDQPTLPRNTVSPLNDSWLSDSRFQTFVALLERANAARVAFYTFDAAGLRAESPFANLAFGRAPYVGLQFLAEHTGGAFVENTNDLGPGIRRAWSDQRHQYTLGYIPAKAPDDTYRKIRVAVADCRRCTVFARRGYRAVRSRGLGQVGARDGAPLLALERMEPADELAARMDVQLRSTPRGPVVRIEAQVAVRGGESPRAPRAVPALVTVLARVRGERQRTLAVLSQHFEVDVGLAGRVETVVFAREVELPPGEYSVDLVGYRHDTAQATIYSKWLRIDAIPTTGRDPAVSVPH